jgi:plastocyanin
MIPNASSSAAMALLFATAAGADPLAGRVTVSNPAAPRIVRVNVDKKFCGLERAAAELEVSPSGGLAHAVVSLESPPPGNLPAPAEVEVAQSGCTYRPHIALVVPGSAIRFTNADPVAHQVRLAGAEMSQNAIQTRNTLTTRRFTTPGEYPVRCDLHPWMSAWAVVMKHPYYAVTDADGRFSLDVPPGRYKLRIWHEVLGTMEGSAATGTPAKLTFTASAPQEPAAKPPRDVAAASVAPTTDRPANTLTRKLQSIQQLRDQGVISPEEYRRIVDLLIASAAQ